MLRLAHELRDAGVRVEYSLRPEAFGKQLKLADARQRGFAVVIGPDDRAKGEVQLKDLRGKAQRAMPLGGGGRSGAASAVRRRLADGRTGGQGG